MGRYGGGKTRGNLRLRLAYWLFCKLGDYIEKHVATKRAPEAVVAVQGPGVLYIDGTWMPDRVTGIQQ